MKNKGLLLLAAVGAAVVLFMGGMFAANTVFAAEEQAAIDNGTSETGLHALTGAEAKKAYKRELYGDIGWICAQRFAKGDVCVGAESIGFFQYLLCSIGKYGYGSFKPNAGFGRI